jgi:organic hydroperoxide reductase OsmC/OhrA
MPPELVHHVTLSLQDGHQFNVSFDDLVPPRTLQTDEGEPLGRGDGPNPAALLAAAAANCLAGSLLFCLRKARANVRGMTARATIRLRRNEIGRLRVAALEVELAPEVDADDANRLDRCEDLFEDFCTVAESIRRGIPVIVNVKTGEEHLVPAGI